MIKWKNSPNLEKKKIQIENFWNYCEVPIKLAGNQKQFTYFKII